MNTNSLKTSMSEKTHGICLRTAVEVKATLKARIKGVWKFGYSRKFPDFANANEWAMSAVMQAKAEDNSMGTPLLLIISSCSSKTDTVLTIISSFFATDAFEKKVDRDARRGL